MKDLDKFKLSANTLERSKALVALWSDDENTSEQESVEEY